MQFYSRVSRYSDVDMEVNKLRAACAYLAEAEHVEERDDVADDVEGGVGGDVGRRAGAAVAAEVGRHAAVAPLLENEPSVQTKSITCCFTRY